MNNKILDSLIRNLNFNQIKTNKLKNNSRWNSMDFLSHGINKIFQLRKISLVKILIFNFKNHRALLQLISQIITHQKL